MGLISFAFPHSDGADSRFMSDSPLDLDGDPSHWSLDDERPFPEKAISHSNTKNSALRSTTAGWALRRDWRPSTPQGAPWPSPNAQLDVQQELVLTSWIRQGKSKKRFTTLWKSSLRDESFCTSDVSIRCRCLAARALPGRDRHRHVARGGSLWA